VAPRRRPVRGAARCRQGRISSGRELAEGFEFVADRHPASRTCRVAIRCSPRPAPGQVAVRPVRTITAFVLAAVAVTGCAGHSTAVGVVAESGHGGGMQRAVALAVPGVERPRSSARSSSGAPTTSALGLVDRLHPCPTAPWRVVSSTRSASRSPRRRGVGGVVEGERFPGGAERVDRIQLTALLPTLTSAEWLVSSEIADVGMRQRRISHSLSLVASSLLRRLIQHRHQAELLPPAGEKDSVRCG
jgi:hypothetical protein